MEILGGKNPKSEQPVAMEILAVGGMKQAELNAAIKKFYDEWSPTHVVLTPQYLIEGTNERVMLQAIERKTVHAQQAKDQGAGSGMSIAYQQYLAETTMRSLQSSVVAPASGGGVKGGFGGRS